MLDTECDCPEGDGLLRASPPGVKSANTLSVRGNEEKRDAIRSLDAQQNVLPGCEHPVRFDPRCCFPSSNMHDGISMHLGKGLEWTARSAQGSAY